MKLHLVLEDLVNARPLSLASIANYRHAIQYLENFVGRSADVSDLTVRTVNAWLASLEKHYAGSYVRNLRRDIKVIWNFAADQELCPYPRSRLIRRSLVEEKPVEAWPIEWIPLLIASTQTMEGNIRRLRLKRSWFCEAYLRVQLELLCRPSDMRALLWSQIEPDGNVQWVQKKTRKPNAGKLSSASMDALMRLRGVHPHVVFPLSKNAIELMIRKVFVKANIIKPNKQSFGHLRHTGGTAIACATNCDVARKALGHTPSSRVFEKHYLDSAKLPKAKEFQWW